MRVLPNNPAVRHHGLVIHFTARYSFEFFWMYFFFHLKWSQQQIVFFFYIKNNKNMVRKIEDKKYHDIDLWYIYKR